MAKPDFKPELVAIHQRLFALRVLQIICCFAAGACAVAPVYYLGVQFPVSVPSATLDFVAGSLTVLKTASEAYLGDKYLYNGHRGFVFDLVSAILMLAAGGNAAAYVKGLPFYSAQLVASYALSFTAGGLLLVSAVTLRRVSRILAAESAGPVAAPAGAPHAIPVAQVAPVAQVVYVTGDNMA